MKDKLFGALLRTVLPSLLGAAGALFATTYPAYYESVCGNQAILPGIY